MSMPPSMNEANFTLARLDTTANQWKPAQKQANDPAGNFVSGTVTEMGYYAVYQRPDLVPVDQAGADAA